ncbi:MAG: amidohydrolase family protein [Myxococcota bacterium]
MIVDTHTHVVSTDETRYPMQCTATDPADPGAWPLRTRVTADELERAMTAAGVARACLVQGYAAYRFDNRYTVASAEAWPRRFVSVCALDPEDADALAALEALARSPRVGGLRLTSGGLLGGRGLDSPGSQRLWDAAERLGLVVSILSLPDGLEAVAASARARPHHPVVLDHCGFVEVVEDFERLASLAPLRNVHLKVSSRVLVQGDPASIVRRLADRFGAGRLMWGSDFPASDARRYADWVELARAGTKELNEEEAADFLADTALRLWPAWAGPA